MNLALLWVVTALYAAQGAVMAHAGNLSGALILTGYVIANIGLIWSLK